MATKRRTGEGDLVWYNQGNAVDAIYGRILKDTQTWYKDSHVYNTLLCCHMDKVIDLMERKDEYIHNTQTCRFRLVLLCLTLLSLIRKICKPFYF